MPVIMQQDIVKDLCETFKFSMVRTCDNDSPETLDISISGEAITHDRLAEIFNRFLSCAGYVGHNYVNDSEK
jgi:hypothetical protein